MVKQGFMKTVEATIAIVLFLAFLAFLTVNQYRSEPQTTPQDITLIQDSVFSEIESNPTYRANALNQEEAQLTNFLDGTIPKRYMHNITVCLAPCSPLSFDTEKEIYVKTLVIANSTKTVYISLYIQEKQ